MKLTYSIAMVALAGPLAACDMAPTTPTALAIAPSETQYILGQSLTQRTCSEAVVEFDDAVFGRATVRNTSACEHTYTLIAWHYISQLDQNEVARHSVQLGPGQSAVLSVGFAEQCETTYQRDVFMDLPPIAASNRYSLMDALGHVFWFAGRLSTTGSCGEAINVAPQTTVPTPPQPTPPSPPGGPTPPGGMPTPTGSTPTPPAPPGSTPPGSTPTPPAPPGSTPPGSTPTPPAPPGSTPTPPTPPGSTPPPLTPTTTIPPTPQPNSPPPPSNGTTTCELKSFATVGAMVVSGTTASITLTLASGYDNIVVYLMAYSSPQAFPQVSGGFQPLFPQTLSHQHAFTLRSGAAQTISIELPTQGVGWQIDAGCLPGPSLLTSRASYPSTAFLEAALGNRTP